jgi:hypothetical protein
MFSATVWQLGKWPHALQIRSLAMKCSACCRLSALQNTFYGVANRHTEMVDHVRGALGLNPPLASILRSPHNVIMLAHACGNNAESLQELGALIGLQLPAPIAALQQSIESIDLTRHDLAQHGIIWYVMGQPARWKASPRPHFPIAVRIFARDESEGRLAGARYFIPVPDQPLIPTDIPSEPGQALPVADLVGRLDEHFLFLCPTH